METSHDSSLFFGLSLINFRRNHPYSPGDVILVDGERRRVASCPFPRQDGRVGLLIGDAGERPCEIVLGQHDVLRDRSRRTNADKVDRRPPTLERAPVLDALARVGRTAVSFITLESNWATPKGLVGYSLH